MTNIIDIATINKLALYAIEKNDLDLFETTLKKHGATNLQECLDKAMQTNFSTAITLILDHMKPQETITKPQEAITKPQEAIKKTRPLVINNNDAYLLNGRASIGKNNSQLILSILKNPLEALKDLNDGIVSKEELDHINGYEHSALSILCLHHHYIEHSKELIVKIIELGADINNSLPLMYLCSYNISEFDTLTESLIDYFLQNKNLSINLKSSRGYTVLTASILYSAPIHIIKKIMQDPRTDLHVLNDGNDSVAKIITNNMINNVNKADLLHFYYSLPNNNIADMTFTSDIIKTMPPSDLVPLVQIFLRYPQK